ncbi:hypothetical protein PUN28_019366 [Cardiocondyla obscurior]|uniref:Uncharacterized protein n=1 Tax=Cardiocondyla obscurior TaxID=286306 RepID=A0AAW2ED62_9HYME
MPPRAERSSQTTNETKIAADTCMSARVKKIRYVPPPPPTANRGDDENQSTPNQTIFWLTFDKAQCNSCTSYRYWSKASNERLSD